MAMAGRGATRLAAVLASASLPVLAAGAAAATPVGHCARGGCAGFSAESVLLQARSSKSRANRSSSQGVHSLSCTDSCDCWNRAVGDNGATCGDRINWLSERLPGAAEVAARMAAARVLQEFPDDCKCPRLQNEYSHREGVGGWGGWCQCPNGERYNVGDRGDSCGSLACVGGVAEACEEEVDATREGMQAICANHYEHVDEGVGSWGGVCTCPDGQTYNVGDKNDGCAQGSLSLACYGGVPGTCEQSEDESRAGMQVTCAAAPSPAPTPAPTQAPTQAPTEAPTQAPTAAPTAAPTVAPGSAWAPTPWTYDIDTPVWSVQPHVASWSWEPFPDTDRPEKAE